MKNIEERLDRLEEKIDRIIQWFNIGETATPSQIRHQAARDYEAIMLRRQKRAEKKCTEKKKKSSQD